MNLSLNSTEKEKRPITGNTLEDRLMRELNPSQKIFYFYYKTWDVVKIPQSNPGEYAYYKVPVVYGFETPYPFIQLF